MIFILFPAFIYSTIQPLVAEGYLNPAFKGIIITHTSLIAFYYFNYYYALPKFYFTKQFSKYVPLVLLWFLLITTFLLTDPNYNPLSSAHLPYATLIFISSVFIRFLMVFLLSIGISGYSRLKQAEQEKLKTELSYLKAQINPHFLFNTLNSIYALTVKKSDAAPEAVTKLSSIMRYVITDAADDLVSLEKEMNYVSAYIELEKLRLTNKVDLNYTVSGQMTGKQIAPLIFIPFIENAFKYGVSTSENSNISISVELQNNDLSLNVRNTKIVSRPPSKENTRLGIETTRKRLNIIYPGKHTLTINETEKEFMVILKMDLA
jgi:hypothetical protein